MIGSILVAMVIVGTITTWRMWTMSTTTLTLRRWSVATASTATCTAGAVVWGSSAMVIVPMTSVVIVPSIVRLILIEMVRIGRVVILSIVPVSVGTMTIRHLVAILLLAVVVQLRQPNVDNTIGLNILLHRQFFSGYRVVVVVVNGGGRGIASGFDTRCNSSATGGWLQAVLWPFCNCKTSSTIRHAF